MINEQFTATISSITVTWSPAADSLQVCWHTELTMDSFCFWESGSSTVFISWATYLIFLYRVHIQWVTRHNQAVRQTTQIATRSQKRRVHWCLTQECFQHLTALPLGYMQTREPKEVQLLHCPHKQMILVHLLTLYVSSIVLYNIFKEPNILSIALNKDNQFNQWMNQYDSSS